MPGRHQTALRQLLQNLSHERRRDAVQLGDIRGTATAVSTMHRQMLDGNQPIISLLRQLQHGICDLFSRISILPSWVAQVKSRDTSKSQYTVKVKLGPKESEFVKSHPAKWLNSPANCVILTPNGGRSTYAAHPANYTQPQDPLKAGRCSRSRRLVSLHCRCP